MTTRSTCLLAIIPLLAACGGGGGGDSGDDGSSSQSETTISSFSFTLELDESATATIDGNTRSTATSHSFSQTIDDPGSAAGPTTVSVELSLEDQAGNSVEHVVGLTLDP